MGSPDEDEIRAINWVARASRPVGSLADPAVVCQCDISDALMVNLNGTPAARVSGLASGLPSLSGPLGWQRVSGAQGRVPKIVSAKRVGTIFGCP